ncbi:MAG: deoxyguanosinetriphosphate triphosphohydrolase-like protein [Candidatus Binatia bacterium]|nr:MAG: deoxyguanosinetriphosphate triphosphohydrolase-like protein [Candidatus Binatia bacterium]
MKHAGLDFEERVLAPYAARSARSRGRVHPECEHPFRSAFQRDRDRIIHSSAFRRLEYKTQVFLNHEGDYYRTRLTHTMEAAQISRTIARALGLNEDLAEAVALAHDLGHTPFGHAGERVLHECMLPYGGFEHNAQSLRIVEKLERRYPGFPGLNLTFEVREGIVKHSPPYDRPLARDFEPGLAPALEAQIVDLADEIAYTAHDIDDGLQSGMLDAGDLLGVELWRESAALVWASHVQDPAVTRYQAIRHLIDRLVTDLVGNVRETLERNGIRSYEDVRRFGKPLAAFREPLREKFSELKAFLFEHLYRHPRVVRMTRKAQRVVRELFEEYMAEPRQLPEHVFRRAESEESLPRVVADYIAGMTDRFALEEHRKLFDPSARV